MVPKQKAWYGRAGLPAGGLILVCLLVLPACGYRPLGLAEPASPAKAVTIAVPPFANRSLEVGLETVLANDLLQALANQPGIRAKAGEGQADYLLLGTISKIEYTSVAYENIDQSLVRRATVTVDLVLKKPQGPVIWRQQEIVKADYVSGPDYHLGEATRDQGLRQASARLAQRVRDKLLLLF